MIDKYVFANDCKDCQKEMAFMAQASRGYVKDFKIRIWKVMNDNNTISFHIETFGKHKKNERYIQHSSCKESEQKKWV